MLCKKAVRIFFYRKPPGDSLQKCYCLIQNYLAVKTKCKLPKFSLNDLCSGGEDIHRLSVNMAIFTNETKRKTFSLVNVPS